MTKINVIKIIDFVSNTLALKKTKIILGGPEVKHHSAEFINIGAHFICIGEGEQTLLELVKAIHTNETNFKNINGIAYKLNEELIFNPERELIKDISILPLPNRKKINIQEYLTAWRQHHGFSMMSVSTMRGCPYTCKWCSRAVYGGSYRRRKPEQVAEELLMLKNDYNPDMIWFVDDVFTIHHKWLKQFADAVLKLNAIIPYEIISRADRLNEDILKNLKASGCKRIWIGAESGSQKIIDAMDRRVSVVDTRKIIQLTKQYGMEAGTFIMLGYPGETKKDIQETIDHLVLSNPTFFTITVAYPIKGTPLFTQVEKEMLVHPNWQTSTDRDLDFKRTHTKKYYQYAVNWVVNTVELKTKQHPFIKKIKLNLKTKAAQLLMFKEQIIYY